MIGKGFVLKISNAVNQATVYRRTITDGIVFVTAGKPHAVNHKVKLVFCIINGYHNPVRVVYHAFYIAFNYTELAWP